MEHATKVFFQHTLPYNLVQNVLPANNTSNTPGNPVQRFFSTDTKCANDHAILDSGAAGNFLTTSAPLTKLNSNNDILRVKLPDGRNISSTMCGELDWPDLPSEARKAYVLPILSRKSLLSVNQVTKVACIVIFQHEVCVIIFNSCIIMHATKCPTTGLWLVPLRAADYTRQAKPQIPTKHLIANIHHTTSQEELVKFIYQCLFSPPVPTLIKAINNNQLLTFPIIKKDIVKILPFSTATQKGHMKRLPQGFRSTRTAKPVDPYPLEDMNPSLQENTPCQMFCAALLANKLEGTIYSDLIGKFPV